VNDQPKTLIVVLGMHRSGTSAITRALGAMNVELGNRLMPAMADNNEKGFWEDIDINNFNEEMLATLNSSWYQLSPINQHDVEKLHREGFFLRAVELLRNKVSEAEIFGIKDPRISKLFPFWQEVFSHCQIKTLYLLALRNPLSVVKSLQKRDGIAPERSYFLWIEYLLTSLHPVIQHGGLVVDYDRLVESSREEIKRIATHFSLTLNEEKLSEYEREFLDPKLRHTAYQKEDLLLDAACPPLASEIYVTLLERCASLDTGSVQLEELEHWQTELFRMAPVFSLADDLERSLREKDGQLVERMDQVRDLSTTIHHRNLDIQQLKDNFEELNHGIQVLRAEIDNQQRLAKEQQQLANERQQQLDELTSVNAQQREQLKELAQHVVDKDRHIENLDALRAAQANTEALLLSEIAALRQSTSWRITSPLRWTGHQLKRAKRILSLIPPAARRNGGLIPLAKKVVKIYSLYGISGLKQGLYATQTFANSPYQPTAQPEENSYQAWINAFDTLTDENRATLKRYAQTLEHQPLISVVMPTYNPNPDWLIEAIESVRNQIYSNWELCIADDVSTDSRILPILKNYAAQDQRIKVIQREKNGHISAASNTALTLVTGEWVALLDHDDLLPEHALFWVAEAINTNPDAQLIYSDEDKIDAHNKRSDPYFKCDWNLDLFYSQNMFSHLGVYRTGLIHKVNGFRVGLEGSQDHDLALRCIELIEPEQIHHIPRVLYHWRVHAESTASSADAKPYAAVAGERALNEHFERTGVAAKVNHIGIGYRTVYALPENPPLVSLIIPTRNGLALLKQCIESILEKTDYRNYEIIVIDNGSDDDATLRYMEKINLKDNIRVVRDDRPFNYSALNNAAVKLAKGELVGLINNDIEVIKSNWLGEMVSHALRPGVGAVGAKLLYPDNMIQHAGVYLGIGDCAHGIAGHPHSRLPAHANGYFNRALLTQALSAVTAACLIVKKSIYEEVNGLNETNLTVAFNDVDLCLRIKMAGYRNVWTPFACLYHHESATRGFEDTPEKQARFAQEVAYMYDQWKDILYCDPAYSPNLSLRTGNFDLAWPPRIPQLPGIAS
jgi:glycosyltransferase involved in cell wall biosynthesis